MEEMKMTDEEIVKAYEYCVLKNGDCDNCMYDEIGCGIDGHDIIDLIHRLQAKNTELQKQVDELKEERENMQAEIIATEERRLQSVKDTAKEILDEIGKISVDKTMNTQTLMFVFNKLKEIAKRYGVEVE